MKHLLIIISCFIATIVSAQSKSRQKTDEFSRNISVDFNTEAGSLNTFFKECVGAGRANEGLRADSQKQLEYVQKACRFRYLRMHGLLTDDMGVYKEDRN